MATIVHSTRAAWLAAEFRNRPSEGALSARSRSSRSKSGSHIAVTRELSGSSCLGLFVEKLFPRQDMDAANHTTSGLRQAELKNYCKNQT